MPTPPTFTIMQGIVRKRNSSPGWRTMVACSLHRRTRSKLFGTITMLCLVPRPNARTPWTCRPSTSQPRTL
uniref:Uncharacterized protein n=1 Tax=Arundo donax TaxID=35708 RepID=A0A0A9CGG5_ARUDO